MITITSEMYQFLEAIRTHSLEDARVYGDNNADSKVRNHPCFVEAKQKQYIYFDNVPVTQETHWCDFSRWDITSMGRLELNVFLKSLGTKDIPTGK